MAKRHNPTADTFPLLARLARHYLWKHKIPLLWAGFAMLIMAAALSLQAHLIQPLFDNGLIDRKIGVLNTVIFALLFLTVIKGISSYYQAYLMEAVGQNMVADLQADMYANTLRQSLGWFAQHPTGTLTSRFISDLQRLKYAVTQIFNAGLRDLGTIIGLFVNMLLQDWKLTLVTLFIVPLTALPIRRFGRLTRKYSKVNQESTALLTHHLSQTLQHVRQVQAYTTESLETKRTTTRIHEVLDSTLRAVRVRALSSPVVELIATVSISLLMLYAARRIANGSLSPGSFASFVTSLIIIIRPLKGITNLNNNLQEGLAAAARAFALIDATPDLQDSPHAQPLQVKDTTITFSRVTLTYPDGTTALKNLTLTIPAGHTVAFVGPSGAGKSSLLNLLPRFYEPSEGTITIGNQNISSVTAKSLRQHIGLVSQDVAIFDATISANISYGTPRASHTAIEKAAKAAAADTFIKQQPQGYATMLGENGLKLSGGQKQRLSIARALLKDAPILLLDEATASLDSKSEKDIQKALKTLTQGRTTLVVAHRLSTITHAHTIYVLNEGEIVEHGTHTQLLKKKNGLYARLWALQASGQES